MRRAEENVQSLTASLPNSQVEPIDIFALDGAVIGGRRVAGLIGDIDLAEYSDVIVDFSSLSKGISFPIVKHVIDLSNKLDATPNLHLMVTDEVTTDIQIKAVASDRATLIPGFEGGWWLSETEEKAKLWVPQLIHDQHFVLDRIYQFVNPDDVCPILPFPAADSHRPDHLIEEYASELQSVWEVEPRDLVYTDEKKPLDVYRSILRIGAARTRVFQETGVPPSSFRRWAPRYWLLVH